MSLKGDSIFTWYGNRLRGAFGDAWLFFSWRPPRGGRQFIVTFLPSVPTKFFEPIGQCLYYMTLIRGNETHYINASSTAYNLELNKELEIKVGIIKKESLKRHPILTPRPLLSIRLHMESLQGMT